MHPVAKRILVNGGAAAGVLALVGVLFTELASVWMAGSAGKPNSADLNPPLMNDALRYRVPLTMAGAGFLFVAVSELVLFAVRGEKKPAAKPAERQPDEAEKLLNELLAQAESKMAQEAESQSHGATEPQTTESREQKTEAEKKAE
jgi:hypothetical protein